MIGRLILFISAATLVIAQCPDPYVPLDDTRCILIEPFVEYDYDGATAYCTQHGGNILMFSDCDTSALIFDFIRSEEGTINHHYWLGASDQTAEGEWKFANGEPVPLGTPFWLQGRPTVDDSRNCAVLHYSYNHYWYDVVCTNAYNVICLRNI